METTHFGYINLFLFLYNRPIPVAVPLHYQFRASVIWQQSKRIICRIGRLNVSVTHFGHSGRIGTVIRNIANTDGGGPRYVPTNM